jgi:hypothetical protein
MAPRATARVRTRHRIAQTREPLERSCGGLIAVLSVQQPLFPIVLLFRWHLSPSCWRQFRPLWALVPLSLCFPGRSSLSATKQSLLRGA